MKTYELSYIVSPEITSEEAEAKGKEIESLVQNREGTIARQVNPTAKTFAYPIKSRASGFLGFLEFNLEPEKLVEVDAIISKDGKIVRHMVIIKEAAELKKDRRTRGEVRVKPIAEITEEKIEKKEEVETEKPTKTKEPKAKVELKDIEQSLDEILS